MRISRTLSLLFVFLLFVGVRPAAAQPVTPEEASPKNVILFITDGTGPASLTLARDYLRYSEGTEMLAVDSVEVGSIHTYASNSRVTDSAAGATAFAAGVKTYNGAIAVDTLQRPVATLLEAAEAEGMATGLVATSRITHATPAAFAAHVPNRGMEAEIAVQELARGIEVLLGGGADFFLPDTLGGRRTDGRNLMAEAEALGYNVVSDRAGFDALVRTPVLGLFTPSHMAYELDRDPAEEPSLAEMTAKAIDLLADDPDGFFLMVEASRIDHAGHANDPAAHLHDVLAFNRAITVALDFAQEQGETLVVSTSDHETGGLSLGRDGVYAWEPAVLARVTASLEGMADRYRQEQMPPCEMLETVASVTCTEDEAAAFGGVLNDPPALSTMLLDVISARAGIGWTTSGHTAVDVPLYAFGPGQARFIGHHDNTAIGLVLADLLDFDLEVMTEALRVEVGSQ